MAQYAILKLKTISNLEVSYMFSKKSAIFVAASLLEMAREATDSDTNAGSVVNNHRIQLDLKKAFRNFGDNISITDRPSNSWLVNPIKALTGSGDS